MASQVEDIKWVPGTDFIVDGFAFQSPRCSHYFLTHFHSDHTVGLGRSFKGGVIYCSHVTARLLVHDMGLRSQVVKPLAVGAPVTIAGVRVTPLDANHCPGAVMFLFEVPVVGDREAAGAAAPARPLTAQGGSRGGVEPEIAGVPAVVGPVGVLRGKQHASSGGPARSTVLGSGTCGGFGASQAGADAGGTGGEREGHARGAEVATMPPSGDGAEFACGRGQAGVGGRAQGSTAVGVDGRSDSSSTTGADTHNILHTGDCRWQPWMRDQPGLAGVRVDTLFLDTTYAAPKHTHPPQQQAISMMVQAMRDALAEEPATLFLVAAYHIGKERAFLGAAQHLGARVWCSDAKRAVLRLLDLPPELAALLVDDPRAAAVHVTGWGLRPEEIQAYLDQHPGVWKRAVGIRPTGWTLRRSGGLSVRREGNVAVIGVPYSEHSSWADLCDAVAQLRPRRLVPTVNAATPAKRRALVDLFAHWMDLSADRSRLDVYLLRGGSGSGALRPSVSAAAAPRTPTRVSAAVGGCRRGSPEVIDLSEQHDDPATGPPHQQRQPYGKLRRRSGREQPGKRRRPESDGEAAARDAKRTPLQSVAATAVGAITAYQHGGSSVCIVDLTGYGEEKEEGGDGRAAVGLMAMGMAGKLGHAAPTPFLALIPAPGAPQQERAEGARSSWQSSIRRFFAPVTRIATALG